MKSFQEKELQRDLKFARQDKIRNLLIAVVSKIEKPINKCKQAIHRLQMKINVRNIDKLEKASVLEIANKLENNLLTKNVKGDFIIDSTALYFEKYWDYGTTLKRPFSPYSPVGKAYKCCHRYAKTKKEMNEEIDYESIYKQVYNHFQDYKDLTVKYIEEKAFVDYSNEAQMIKYILIEKIRRANKYVLRLNEKKENFQPR